MHVHLFHRIHFSHLRNTKLDEQRTRRQQIHEDTLRDVDQNVLQISEIHDARLMDIQKTETQASRVHAEMLQRMQEEDRLRAERRAQRQRETEEEIRRLEAERRNPGKDLHRSSLEHFVYFAQHNIRKVWVRST